MLIRLLIAFRNLALPALFISLPLWPFQSVSPFHSGLGLINSLLSNTKRLCSPIDPVCHFGLVGLAFIEAGYDFCLRSIQPSQVARLQTDD